MLRKGDCNRFSPNLQYCEQEMEREGRVLGEQQKPGPPEGVRQEILQEVLPFLRAPVNGRQVDTKGFSRGNSEERES
jgi:hypothetical protein